MPTGAVPQMPPQLPPLSPLPSLASLSNWKLHYPPEDTNFPPSSWSTPSSSSTSLRRSQSTSPPRRLPDPHKHAVGGSTSRLHAGPAPSSYGSSSRTRTHSHSRSRSRVPLPVLPSASSSEPIIISPPRQSHSRSVSAGVPRFPPRPSSAGKDGVRLPPRPSTADKDAPRPLPRPPKPMPLPLSELVHAREQSFPLASIPKVTTSATTAVPPFSAAAAKSPTPLTPRSAPPRPQLRRQVSSPQVRRAAEPVSPPSVSVPKSTPTWRADKETEVGEREKEPARGRPGEKEIQRKLDNARARATEKVERPHFLVLSPDQVHLELHQAAFSTLRSPTPPRSRSATGRSRQVTNPRLKEAMFNARMNPPSAFPPPARGLAMGAVVALRSPPRVIDSLKEDSPPSAPPSRPAEGYARKWVVEKNGKRLTQDSTFVVQQLRMLR